MGLKAYYVQLGGTILNTRSWELLQGGKLQYRTAVSGTLSNFYDGWGEFKNILLEVLWCVTLKVYADVFFGMDILWWWW